MTTPTPEPTPAAPKDSPGGRPIAAAAEREFAAAERLLAQHKLGHLPHPHLARRAAAGPVTAADQLPRGGALARVNTRVGVAITRAVGTMWCAYLFAALALISLPNAIRGGSSTMVSWTAQTLLQLVLLSIIMVGQNVQSPAGDARAKATYDDGEAILHYADAHSRRLAELHAKLDEGLAHVHARLDELPKTLVPTAVSLNLPAPALRSERAVVGVAEKIGQKLTPKAPESEPLAAPAPPATAPADPPPPAAAPPAVAPDPTPPVDGPAGSASTS